MRFSKLEFNGNPDRVCDLIASGIVDEYLKRDPETRIRCRVSGGKGAVFVTGEVLSQADFDVARLVQRLLGKYGIYEQTDSFIALENVTSENVGRFRAACTEPLVVTGYATQETPSCLPKPMHLARLIVAELDRKRRQDPDWFWLGTTGHVAVFGQSGSFEVVIEIDTGGKESAAAKNEITNSLQSILASEMWKLTLNALGSAEGQGFAARIGKSGTAFFPYGQGVPMAANFSGVDWHRAEVYGQWLARRIARIALHKNGSQAVLSELLFMPGDEYPTRISVRDETGKSLMTPEDAAHWRSVFDGMGAWRKPGLMEAFSDFPFKEGFPWESE